MHKERYVLPVSLNVTKVSGIGEDTMFMGILEVRGLPDRGGSTDGLNIWCHS
jgi:hypothetical protein